MKEERCTIFPLSSFSYLFFQTFQAFHQSLERAFGSFGGGGIGEADPVVAERGEECAGDDGNAVIFGKVLSERFAVSPTFGFDKFTDIHEGVITFANDVLHSVFGEQFLQYYAAGVGRFDDGLGGFLKSHFVGSHGNCEREE